MSDVDEILSGYHRMLSRGMVALINGDLQFLKS